MRKLSSLLVVCMLAQAAAHADESISSASVVVDVNPDATLTLMGGSIAAGVGYTWGKGELDYAGRVQRFSIIGVSLVDVGATNFSASGQVYNLKKLEEFPGNYVAAGAGIAVAGGGTALLLKNEHGVIVKLVSSDVGLKFTLSAEGVLVDLRE